MSMCELRCELARRFGVPPAAQQLVEQGSGELLGGAEPADPVWAAGLRDGMRLMLVAVEEPVDVPVWDGKIPRDELEAMPLLTLLNALQKAGGVADDRLGALETKAQTIELLLEQPPEQIEAVLASAGLTLTPLQGDVWDPARVAALRRVSAESENLRVWEESERQGAKLSRRGTIGCLITTSLVVGVSFLGTPGGYIASAIGWIGCTSCCLSSARAIPALEQYQRSKERKRGEVPSPPVISTDVVTIGYCIFAGVGASMLCSLVSRDNIWCGHALLEMNSDTEKHHCSHSSCTFYDKCPIAVAGVGAWLGIASAVLFMLLGGSVLLLRDGKSLFDREMIELSRSLAGLEVKGRYSRAHMVRWDTSQRGFLENPLCTVRTHDDVQAARLRAYHEEHPVLAV
jgi:hypothetical protein